MQLHAGKIKFKTLSILILKSVRFYYLPTNCSKGCFCTFMNCLLQLWKKSFDTSHLLCCPLLKIDGVESLFKETLFKNACAIFMMCSHSKF